MKLTKIFLLGVIGMTSVFSDIYANTSNDNKFDVDIRELKPNKPIDIKQLKSKFKNDIWYIKSSSKTIAIKIIFKNEGSRNDQNSPGLLKLMISNLFEGTSKYSGVELKKILEDKSININITSTLDNIYIDLSCLEQYLDSAIDILRELISNAKFPEDKLKMIKESRIQKLKQSKFDPNALAHEKLDNMVCVEEYKYSIDEIIKKIPSYNRKEILKIYKQIFAPDDAIITVSGNIDPDKFVKKLERIYDATKCNNFKKGKQVTELEKSDKYAHVEIDNPQAVVMFALPGVLNSDKDKIAIRAAVSMFGDGAFSSRLVKSVRVEKGLVYGIWGLLQNKDLQSYLRGIAPTRPENIEKVINEITNQCEKIYNEGLTEEELKEFKIKKASQYVFSNSLEIVSFVSERREDNVPINEVNNYLNEYLNLELSDINKALKKVFNPNNLIFVSAGKKQKIEKQQESKQQNSKTNKQIYSNKNSLNEDNIQNITESKQNLKTDNIIDIYNTVLENGLKVIVLPIESADSVIAGIGYNVGSADDHRDTVGISHFVEHMMFKRTKNIKDKPGEPFTFYQERYTKYYNGWTTDDYTFYPFECNKAFLNVNLKLDAERMTNLIFDENEIESEKNVIIEERKMRVESHPRFKYAYEAARKALYLYSNYSYPTIGYIDQIKSCNKQNMEAHYKKYYVPSNAFALFVGNITPNEAVELCQKHFGKIPSGNKINRKRVSDPINTGLTHKIEYKSDQLTSNFLDIYYKIPIDLTSSLKNIMTLQIGLGILGHGESSLLYKTIVEEKKLAHNIFLTWGLFETYITDSSPLCITVDLKDNVKFKTVEEATYEVINNYLNKLLTPELVKIQKQKILDKIDKCIDKPWDIVYYITQFIVSNYKIEDIKMLRNIVQSIKLEDIKESIKKILCKQPSVILYSSPEAYSKQ